MRKLILLLCFAMLPIAGLCPLHEQLMILKTEPIQPFDPMLWAFQKVESNFDTKVINKLGYGGILQIGQEMVDEVNRICELREIKKHFVLNDRLDSLKSVQMWYIFQKEHNPEYNLRGACKLWNPLASQRYTNKVKGQTIVALYNQMLIQLFKI